MASSTAMRRPDISMSMATACGRRWGKRSTPPLSGMMPKVASGKKNCAWLAAMIKSAASASSKPPPAA